MTTVENMEELARSISFEIQPIPQDKIHVAGATDKIPLNVKIKVRKKPDSTTAKNAVVAIPKLGHTAQDTVRLVSSDQTIMSFKVFMEDAEQEKLERKVKKSFFGFFKAAGANPDVESDDTKANQKLVEEKIETNNMGETTISYKTKLVRKEYKGILGKCKPGGCLDPPFGEDRYEYKISNTRRSTGGKVELKSKVSEITKSSSQPEEIESLKKYNKVVKDNREIDLKSSSDSILKLYPGNKLKPSVDISFSNSIITYPPAQTSSELLKFNADNEKSIKTKNSSEKRTPSFQGSTEIYFPSKKDSKSHNRSKSQSSNKIDSILNILPIPINRAQSTSNNVPDQSNETEKNSIMSTKRLSQAIQRPKREQLLESEHPKSHELGNQTDYSKNTEKLIEPHKISNELIYTRDSITPKKMSNHDNQIEENETLKPEVIYNINGSKMQEADNVPKHPMVVTPVRNLSDTKTLKNEKSNSITSKISISKKLKESILSHDGGVFKPIKGPQNIFTSERDSNKSLESTKLRNSVENTIPSGLNNATKLRKTSKLNDGSIDIYSFPINEKKSEDSFSKPEKTHNNEYLSNKKTLSKENTQLQKRKISSRPNSANLSRINQDTLDSSNEKHKRPSKSGRNTENIIKSESRNESSIKSHSFTNNFKKESPIESVKFPVSEKLNELKDTNNIDSINKFPAIDETKLNVLNLGNTVSKLKLPEHDDPILKEQIDTDESAEKIKSRNSVNKEYENDERQPKSSLTRKNISNEPKTMKVNEGYENDQIKAKSSSKLIIEPISMQIDKELQKEQFNKKRDNVLSLENTEAKLKISDNNDQINDTKEEQNNTYKDAENISQSIKNSVNKENENDQRQPKSSSNLKYITSEPETMQFDKELLKNKFSIGSDKFDINNEISSNTNSKIHLETKQTIDTSNIKQYNKPEYAFVKKIESENENGRYLNNNNENSLSSNKINLPEINETNVDKFNAYENHLGEDRKNIIEIKSDSSKDERKMSTQNTITENLSKTYPDKQTFDSTDHFNNDTSTERTEKIWKSEESLKFGNQKRIDAKPISEPHQESPTSRKSETQQIGNQINVVVTNRKRSELETKPNSLGPTLFGKEDTSKETQDERNKILGIIKPDTGKSAEITTNSRGEKAQNNKTSDLRNSQGRLSDLQKDIDKIINDNLVRISRISSILRRGSKQQDKAEKLQDPDKNQIIKNILRTEQPSQINENSLTTDHLHGSEEEYNQIKKLNNDHIWTQQTTSVEPFEKLDLVDSKIEILKPFKNSESNISVNLSFISDNSLVVDNRNDNPVSSVDFMKSEEDQVGVQRTHWLDRDAEEKDETEKVITVNKEYLEMIRNSHQKDNNSYSPNTLQSDDTNGIIVVEQTNDKKEYNSYDIPTSTNNDDVIPKYNKLSAKLSDNKFEESDKAESAIISIEDNNDNDAINQEKQNRTNANTDMNEKLSKSSFANKSEDSSLSINRKTTSITPSSTDNLRFSQMSENKANENSQKRRLKLSDKLESTLEPIENSEFYYSDKPYNLDRKDNDKFKKIIPQNQRRSFEYLDNKVPQNNEDIQSKLSEFSLEDKHIKIKSTQMYNKNNSLRETAASLGKSSSSLNTNDIDKKTVNTHNNKKPGQSQLNLAFENCTINDEKVGGLLKSALPFDPYSEYIKFQNRNSNRTSPFSSASENEMIFFDVSFQSYINEDNQTTFKSVNEVNTIKRYTNDRIMTIKSVVQPNFSKIKVPVDSNNDLLIIVLKKDNNETQILNTTDATIPNMKSPTISTEKSTKEFKKRISMKDVEKPSTSEDSPGLDKTLSLVYEQQLLPLQNIIQKLKQEIDSLTAQQELFRQSVLGTGKPKYVRVTSYVKKCGCHRKYN